MYYKNEDIVRHIRRHSEGESVDRDAVTTLSNFLKSDGKITPYFLTDDKTPNIDGRFELVPNPKQSRKPVQNFFVQIKSTNIDRVEENGTLKYCLQNLAFPAYLYKNVTLDPGILFVVVNPSKKGQERVFWKYISVEFLGTIDFTHNSATITFNSADEIEFSNAGIDRFCVALEEIYEQHSFVKKLENREYTKEEIYAIISACDQEITESIDRFEECNDTRDNVSKRILTKLNDLCVAALLLNAMHNGASEPSVDFAWEQALMNIDTKYLASFYKMLRYPGSRVPSSGQAERLMLKYYNFLWQIKKDLRQNFELEILSNLDKFPLKTRDKVDEQYYNDVGQAIEKMPHRSNNLKKSRYYIRKRTPFFVNGERYYEITLQLAGLYASKYDRVTVYTKKNIYTEYSIQIGYEETSINLWDIPTKIKVITDWRVSIEPECLNKLAKILKQNVVINSAYKEYNALMAFLTRTGINLTDFIDLNETQFSRILDSVYSGIQSPRFKSVLLLLQKNYSKQSNTNGRNVVRYLLVRLREETLECVLPTKGTTKFLSQDLYIKAACYPFEKNPFLSNLAGSKTSGLTFTKDIARAVGVEKMRKLLPYLALKRLVGETREVYYEENGAEFSFDAKDVDEYNSSLDAWECDEGYQIKRENGTVCIDSYERDTIAILKRLREFTKGGNKGQKELNSAFLNKLKTRHGNKLNDEFDNIKLSTLQNVFVDSRLLLIYGAAGTGKTTMINLISNLMGNRKKLFLTKTHSAKKNLERLIDNPGSESQFVSIDSFSRKINPGEFDLIFVDECSTIDNYTMLRFLRKISDDVLLVFAGDIYQIESIDFGNWFHCAKNIITAPNANVELLFPWRTNDKKLIGLWNEVRNRGDLIEEKLAYDGPYSKDIGPSILDEKSDDSVVLCLNYDGKFGLNNINAYFQNANSATKAVTWQEWTYKVGDRILFNESKRFPILYNNLKGRIFDIELQENEISFTVDVETILTELDCKNEEIEFLGVVGENSTRIKFTVYEFDGTTTGEARDLARKRSVVPFHLAYAVSIHKAQGLEYNDVSIVIPSSNSEKITHGIFYTAITRAKKKLHIYWGANTMDEIIKNIKKEKTRNKSLEIIKKKLND